MSGYKPEVWTTRGLVNHIYDTHEQMPDRAFAFILGAGASVSSGIPSAGALVDRWLSELKERLDHSGKMGLKEWATPENTGIDNFDYGEAASFYSAVYKRRFRDDEAAGFACIEHIMEKGAAGLGYAVLARILADTQHKVVITTNFDNLVSDALANHTSRYPLVVGHESLSNFVSTSPRRPLIAKIHRDVLLNPISDEKTSILQGEWKEALAKLFERYTPIVLGYGGNDDSLMDHLLELDKESIPGGIFWCHREGNSPKDKRILEVVGRQQGNLVSIKNFDEFMLEVGERFGIGFQKVRDELEKRGAERLEKFILNFEKIQKDINARPDDKDEDSVDLKRAVNAGIEGDAADRSETANHWWDYQLRINKERDIDKKERLYHEAIKALPESHKLIGNFALFLHEIRKDDDEAERLYLRALELDPNHANITGNFASFMEDIRKDDDEAEKLYHRALELDPNDANITGNFASFMTNVSKDEAERLYRRALELNPNHANHTGNFALFMANVRKDDDEAERLYRRTLKLDPNDAYHTGNFALFMANVRKDDEAERLYRRALELDPNDANHTGNFATFMKEIRKEHDEAERLYRRALELDPSNTNLCANFSTLLIEVGEIEKAKEYAKRAATDDETPTQAQAEGLLYLALIEQLSGGDDTAALSRLKGVLAAGYQRGGWDFAPLFEAVADRLDAEVLAFYRLLGAAILDEDAVAPLEQQPRWQELEAIPPN